MNKLPVFTIEDIRDLEPCYDPEKFLPLNWKGTTLDILNVSKCPAEDRMWVVLHFPFVPRSVAVLFAEWCAKRAKKHATAAARYAADAAAADAAAAYAAARYAATYAATYADAVAAAYAVAYAAAYAAARTKERNMQIRQLKKLLREYIAAKTVNEKVKC